MPSRPNHNSVVVVWRGGRDGVPVEFLVLDSTNTNPKYPLATTTVFAGGGGEGSEAPDETAIRELKEETGLVVKDKASVSLLYRNGKSHVKYGFVVNESDCGGVLRTVDLKEADSRLGPPYWLKVKDALPVIHRHEKNESHFHIGLAAAEHIADKLGVGIESVFD